MSSKASDRAAEKRSANNRFSGGSTPSAEPERYRKIADLLNSEKLIYTILIHNQDDN